MALNVKQKYPGTQGGAVQLYASDTRLSLRRREQVFTRLSKKTWIFQAPEAPAPAAPAMKKWLFCWMRKDADARSVDATWRISSSSLRVCARQDCFVFERPQVVFYCKFSSSKTREQKCQSQWRFYACRFSRRCVHSHWRPLFSHEALNVGKYHARNSSRCVRALSLSKAPSSV